MGNYKIAKETKEAIDIMDEIEKDLILLKKSGVKKLPKSIKNGLNKVDKQFKDMEKMFKKAKNK